MSQLIVVSTTFAAGAAHLSLALSSMVVGAVELDGDFEDQTALYQTVASANAAHQGTGHAMVVTTKTA